MKKGILLLLKMVVIFNTHSSFIVAVQLSGFWKNIMHKSLLVPRQSVSLVIFNDKQDYKESEKQEVFVQEKKDYQLTFSKHMLQFTQKQLKSVEGLVKMMPIMVAFGNPKKSVFTAIKPKIKLINGMVAVVELETKKERNEVTLVLDAIKVVSKQLEENILAWHENSGGADKKIDSSKPIQSNTIFNLRDMLSECKKDIDAKKGEKHKSNGDVLLLDIICRLNNVANDLI